MDSVYVYESPGVVQIQEDEVARRWWSLPPGVLLPLSNGDTGRLVFAGRPGGAIGPDVRDAVLLLGKRQVVGEIEFHVRASDWFGHQHHLDARYNTVILHVVLICDTTTAITCQSGKYIPMCSLYDISPTSPLTSTWPCQHVMYSMDKLEREQLFRCAGLLRFEAKAHTFVELLHLEQASRGFSAYDICLISAIAEGLAYGRDRAFFRATGRFLLGIEKQIPEPLGHTQDATPLDAFRLSLLRKLIDQWRRTGAWSVLQQAMLPTHQQSSPHEIFTNLRTHFGALSKARIDILLCNVIFPFALAVSLIENDILLAKQAEALYLAHPGLPSNQISRAMCRQLQLRVEPAGSCQQQGLHYIYQHTCREKHCEQCIVGRRVL